MFRPPPLPCIPSSHSSKASGADGLLVSVGGTPKPIEPSPKARLQSVTAGTAAYNVMTLSASGTHPEVKAEGTRLVVGGQTVEWKAGRLVLGKFKPE